MSDLLQLRNNIFEPNRSIIANNIVGRFFKFNNVGEPTFFFGNTTLIESLSDNIIKYICDIFISRESKIFKDITGNDIFFRNLYPKCYNNNRKKYSGIPFDVKIKFLKFLVLENKLTKKEIILVLFNLLKI